MTSFDSRGDLMTGREKLEQLAAARGLSVKTAERYLKAGVDLSDPDAVEAHKQKVRSRTGVSKNFRRTLSDSGPVQPGSDLDTFTDVIWRAHMILVNLRIKRPDLHDELSEILKITGPAIDRITEAAL
jgi:hypothetical protein